MNAARSKAIFVLLVTLVLVPASCTSTNSSDKPPPNPATQPSAPTPLADFGIAKPLLEPTHPLGLITRNKLIYAADIAGVSVYRLVANKPQALAHVDTSGYAHDVAIVGDTLIVADGRHGAALFSLKDEVRPRVTGQTALPGDCTRVVGSSVNMAVLCSGGFLAIGSPGQSTSIIAIAGEPKDAAWVGTVLYVASAGEGLLRIEKSATEQWQIVRRDATLRLITAVGAVGPRVFVGLRDKRVLEVDTARTPARVLGEVKLKHRPTRFDIQGNVLLVASVLPGDTESTFVDVAVTGKPRIYDPLPYPVASGVFADESSWLLARGIGGLSLHSTTHQQPDTTVAGNFWNRMAAGDGRAIAWNEDSSNAITWNVPSTEAMPHPFPGGPFREIVACDHAWCTLESPGQVCRRPFDAEQNTCINVTDGGTSLAWQTSTRMLWLLETNGTLRGFEVSTELRQTVEVPRPRMLPQESLSRLVTDGNRAVAIESSFGILQVFELAPTPRRAGFFLLHAKPTDVALVGDHAFVAEPTGGVQIIDIHDPNHPHEADWLPLPIGPFGIHARRQNETWRIALAQGEAGVSTWHWHPDKHFVPERSSDTSGIAHAAQFVGDNLWVADGTNILQFVSNEVHP